MVEFAGFKCEVQVEKYQSGYKAIRLVDQEDGQSVVIATVNLDELDSDEIAIKDYSENEGVYDALLDAGVIFPKHRELSTGFVTVPVCKLTNDYTI
jgi:hypothetical protein